MSDGKGGGSLKSFYIIFAVVAAVGLGAVGFSIGSRAMSGAVSEPVDLEGIEDMQRLTELAVPVTIGDEDAPVTIVLFEDYLCNHCAVFSLNIKDEVVEALVQTGKARLVYYDFPLNPQLGSFLAARAARCAGDQDRFWEFHNQLMRNQRYWVRDENKLPTFEEYAEEIGMDVDQFNGCLKSDEHAEVVSANLQLAQMLGLPGTPAVLVGTAGGMSRNLPDYSFQTIKATVDSILGG